jgi:hypothetical protein
MAYIAVKLSVAWIFVTLANGNFDPGAGVGCLQQIEKENMNWANRLRRLKSKL